MRGVAVENHKNEFDRRTIAAIFAESAIRGEQLAALARLSGCITVARDSENAADYLLIDLPSKMDKHQDSLSEIVEYLDRHRSVAVVWTDMNGLEEAYAALPQGQCHFLVDANDAEAMPILTGAFGRGAMDQVHDRNRDIEFGSLHRISDELAEFARTLSRMADTDAKSRVSDKPVSFRPAPVGGFQAFPTATPANPAITAKSVREIIKKRRLRERFFGAELFADPAWDILLDLKAAGLEGQNVSVSSLCIAAAVPPTTALRWVFIELSGETNAKLDDYFTAANVQFGQITL
jgi:hypothetical protein